LQAGSTTLDLLFAYLFVASQQTEACTTRLYIDRKADMEAEKGTDFRSPDHWLPAVLLLFVGSGCAALVYEIVWFQMLELFVGSSSVSMAVLLGTFMGGMCLGSFLLPRVVSAARHPLRVYAVLELSIGAIGLLLIVIMPLVGRVYTSWGGYGVTGYLLRGLVAAVCLLPPTLAMGATLPAIARWVKTTRTGVSWLGFFYAGNIAGAVLGCLLAGFYLLRVYNMTISTLVAVILNTVVGGAALLLAARTNASATSQENDSQAGESRPQRFGISDRLVYFAIALSGFCALSAEVIWTRLLGLLFGASTYTFSIILAVFLVGLGIGSGIGSLMARTIDNPRVAFGWCQLLNVLAIAWGACMIMSSLPYWPIDLRIVTNIGLNFQLDFARGFWAALPGPVLWGASFPLAVASLARKGEDPGRLVGGIYAANTVGAIFGSLLSGLVLVYWFGSQRAQQIVIILSAISGLLLLGPIAFASKRMWSARGWLAPAALLIALGVSAYLVATVPKLPGILVAYGRFAPVWLGHEGDIFYVGEGLSSSVAVSRWGGDRLLYHNAGKVQASSVPRDMRLQRMLGHFTTLTPKEPKKVLVIGCGAGVTAGAVSIDPRVEHLVIAEIEPLVPRVVSEHFGEYNFNVIRNPKTEVVIDDARHYLVTTHEKFDAITSDLLDSWVKGVAMLYTKEFFELAKSKLNPGGAVTVWVNINESTPEAVKSQITSFFEVFPHGIIWGNTHKGLGYDTVLLGTVEPPHFDVDEWQAKLDQPEYAAMKKSLQEVGIFSAVELFANYAGRASELKSYTTGAQINYDRDLRLQYLAGLGLNRNEGDKIYADILQYNKFPEGLFSGSEETMMHLRTAVETAPGGNQ
jgi:spermidine synthase